LGSVGVWAYRSVGVGVLWSVGKVAADVPAAALWAEDVMKVTAGKVEKCVRRDVERHLKTVESDHRKGGSRRLGGCIVA
jgi:hypothetical protein